MANTIQQTVTFPVRASRLYAMYADSKLHTAATGQPAAIGKAAGGRFSAFKGMITGKLLHLKKNKLIVQTWRGKHWKASDPDSVLILRFEDTRKGGRVNLVHANIPAHDQKGVSVGWKQFYWDPWEKFLSKPAASAKPAAKRRKRPVRRKVAAKAARKPARKATARKAAGRRAPARRTTRRRR